jgi:hypothetical protein
MRKSKPKTLRFDYSNEYIATLVDDAFEMQKRNEWAAFAFLVLQAGTTSKVVWNEERGSLLEHLWSTIMEGGVVEAVVGIREDGELDMMMVRDKNINPDRGHVLLENFQEAIQNHLKTLAPPA